jgi:organic hydroperoxide reductase OsmC/OhrA
VVEAGLATNGSEGGQALGCSQREVPMAIQHAFHAHLTWQKGGEGVAVGNHRVEFAGRPAVEVSAAPPYRGDPSKLNPEELFLASLVSCQMLTYLALASRAGVEVVAYEDGAEATLTIADRKMRVTEVVLHPRITIAGSADEAKARSLVEAAHDGCFIANSVACAVRAEVEIVRAP